MSVTTQAIESIRAMIVDGRLEPGDRLPPEQELAEQLGLSRGSLREAVRALAQIKVLDVRRGDGTYVRSLQPSDLLSGMVFALELVQARGLDEVLEVRRLLFPPAAGLAAQRVTVDATQRDALGHRRARGCRRLGEDRRTAPSVPGDRRRRNRERVAQLDPAHAADRGRARSSCVAELGSLHSRRSRSPTRS